ncbi:MAG TPA: class I SAM-dependent methyltransferase [Solirubrobacteraceae bacterium]|nr:class I SAM-dependent methyltransferase [Solirubrobacteraceae bacterium]
MPREAIGLEWNGEGQLSLCREMARQKCFGFPEEASDDETEYYAANGQFPPLDAWVLEGVLRHFKPRRMIEIGCGFSSLVSARTNCDHLDLGMELTCIEPYPRPFLLSGVPGITNVRVERIQDTPLELFVELGKDDIVFVDTSHTVKTGGDVTWIFHEIVPRLAAGVIVHIHDFFLPGDYPEPWVMEGWGWNETYLVRSFLTFNSAFKVLWGTKYMLIHHPDDVRVAFPNLDRYSAMGGASLWIQRLDDSDS